MASTTDLPDETEKRSQTADTTAVPPQEQADQPPESKRRLPPVAKAWLILFVHGGACIVLALAMALGLDGYEAGDNSNPHYVDGRLLLRVSDITTLVSVALVIIKIIMGSWSTTILWGSGHYMLYRSKAPTRAVSSMMRWKLPPLLQRIPRDFPNLTISVAMLAILIQAFISPILTGSVDWDAGIRVSNTAVSVSSVDPTAYFGGWYWYNAQGSFDKRASLRTAAGFASLAWADPSTMGPDGKSLSGNGCRHLVNNDGLPPRSVLVDAIQPCIDIHGIRWYRSTDEISDDEWGDVSGDDLTLVDDNPFFYYTAGMSIVYDANRLREYPETTDEPPPARMFSDTMTVVLLVDRIDVTDPPCTGLTNTKFGNIDELPYHVQSSGNNADENCYLIGKINFTAGVTRSSRASYITPRIVEDQTPIGEVKFEPNPWVRDALWLMPDLMTMLSVMNASQLPTFNNVDGYVSGLVRQGFLGAWDMFSHSFDESGPSYSAFPANSRIVADISYPRVFSWLAGCLLMTVSGTIALGLVLRAEDLKLPEEERQEQRDARQEEVAGIGQTFLETVM